jgi:hypothetical protein
MIIRLLAECGKIALIATVIVLFLSIVTTLELGFGSGREGKIILQAFQDGLLPSLVSLPYAIISVASIHKSEVIEQRSRGTCCVVTYLAFLLLTILYVDLDDFHFTVFGNKEAGFVILNYALFAVFFSTWTLVQRFEKSQSD